jgi:hypothetical protein
MEKSFTLDWIGGECPVQAEGKVNGYPFYFRARGVTISFLVFKDVIFGEVIYNKHEGWGIAPFEAGYIPQEDALEFINKCVSEFQNADVQAR